MTKHEAKSTVIVYGASEEVLQQVRESLPEVELIRGEDYKVAVVDSITSFGEIANKLMKSEPIVEIGMDPEPELPFDRVVHVLPKRPPVEYIQRFGRGTRPIRDSPLPVVDHSGGPAYGPPGREGYYWARWHTPCPGTADNGECCNPDEWMVCHVVENCLDARDPEFLMVEVPGVEKWQPLSAFEWGKEVCR